MNSIMVVMVTYHRCSRNTSAALSILAAGCGPFCKRNMMISNIDMTEIKHYLR